MEPSAAVLSDWTIVAISTIACIAFGALVVVGGLFYRINADYGREKSPMRKVDSTTPGLVLIEHINLVAAPEVAEFYHDKLLCHRDQRRKPAQAQQLYTASNTGSTRCIPLFSFCPAGTSHELRPIDAISSSEREYRRTGPEVPSDCASGFSSNRVSVSTAMM